MPPEVPELPAVGSQMPRAVEKVYRKKKEREQPPENERQTKVNFVNPKNCTSRTIFCSNNLSQSTS